MSPKLALLIIGIVLLSHFLRYALGEGAEFLIFIGIAIVSIYAIVRYELTLRFLARVLGSQPKPRQSLVNLENSAVRPDIAWSIDEPAPAVPLRGSRETFGYPKSSYTVLRVIAVFNLVMLALVLIVVARDPSQMGKPLDFRCSNSRIWWRWGLLGLLRLGDQRD
jgi:hypothetical protein